MYVSCTLSGLVYHHPVGHRNYRGQVRFQAAPALLMCNGVWVL